MDPSTLNNLKPRASTWTLADDSQLCSVFEDLTKTLTERTKIIDTKLNDMVRNVGLLNADIDNTNSAINLLASTQFIEQKVAEETTSRPATVVVEIKPKTIDQRRAETLACLTSAVKDGISFVETQFEKVQNTEQPQVILDENVRLEPHIKPMDTYDTWNLPYVIGTMEFYTKDTKHIFSKESATAQSSSHGLYNESSLLPSTSFVQEKRLAAHPGPSTSTPIQINAPVSLSDSVLETKPKKEETVISKIPAVPDMNGYQREKTPHISVPEESPSAVPPSKTIAHLLSEKGPILAKKSTLFDDSDNESDEDDIFTQAKRFITKKPIAEDSMSRKSNLSQDSKKSSAPVSDSGRGTPISQKDSETVVSVNGFQPPSLSDVLNASTKLKKANSSDASKTSQGPPLVEISKKSILNRQNLIDSSDAEAEGAIDVNSDVVLDGHHTSGNFFNIDNTTKVSTPVSYLENSKIIDQDSDHKVATDVLKIANSAPDARPTLSDVLPPIAVNQSTTNPKKKITFVNDPSEEKKRITQILEKKQIPTTKIKSKSLFDSDSDTDDLFTSIKKPNIQKATTSAAPVAITSSLATRVPENKKSVIPTETKKLPSKSLFSDDSDEDSLFIPKPPASKVIQRKIVVTAAEPPKELSPEVSAVGITSQQKDYSPPSSSRTTSTEDLFGKEVQKVAESKIETELTNSTTQSSCIGPEHVLHIAQKIASTTELVVSKEISEVFVEQEVSTESHTPKETSLESIWDKPPELPTELENTLHCSSDEWSNDSDDSDMSVKGKLATSAFANKLNATLARPPPPGGVRLFPSAPKSVDVKSVDENGGAKPKLDFTPPSKPAPVSASTEKLLKDSSTKLFDDNPSFLTSTLKGRVKGPTRRPPTKNLHKSSEDNRSAKDNDEFDKPKEASKTMIDIRSSTSSSCEDRHPSNLKPPNPNPEIKKLKSTGISVLSNPPLKESTGSIGRKISITTSSLKDDTAKSALSTSTVPPISKKSIFDSESSDDDLFKKKATFVVKKTSVVGLRNVELNKPPPAASVPKLKDSSDPVSKRVSVKAPVKKTLFDDSDDDLDLFKKK